MGALNVDFVVVPYLDSLVQYGGYAHLQDNTYSTSRGISVAYDTDPSCSGFGSCVSRLEYFESLTIPFFYGLNIFSYKPQFY